MNGQNKNPVLLVILSLMLLGGLQTGETSLEGVESLSLIAGDDDLAEALGCDPTIMKAASRFEHCEVFILGRDCSQQDLRMCIRMSQEGEFEQPDDEEDCVGCNKTNWGEVIVGSLGMVAGPLSSYFTNREWSRATRDVGEARWNAFGKYADAMKEFPQACVKGFDSYLDHRTQLGINSALSADGSGKFFDQCSNLSQYSGFSGLFANGFGGHGNSWIGGGYSPGFLSGMLGPRFGGGGGGYSMGGGLFPGASSGISIGGGISIGMGGGFPMGGGIGMGGGFPYPGMGGGIGMGGGFPYPGMGGGIGMGGGFPYPGMGGGIGMGGGFPYPGMGGGIGMGGGFPHPGMGGGIGMGGGFPYPGMGGGIGMGGGFPYPGGMGGGIGMRGGISIGGGIGMGGGGYPGMISCITAPCPGGGLQGGGVYPNFHVGIPGQNPFGPWAGSMGLNPWMNGGGGYFYGTGGWGNNTGQWNSGHNRFYGPGGGGHLAYNNYPQNQGLYEQQRLQDDQNRAVQERMRGAAQTQSLQSRGLYENYYNAGSDYYNHLSGGGAYGAAPYGPSGLQHYTSL